MTILRLLFSSYDLLGISFDSYLGESFYRDKVPALVDELKEKGIILKDTPQGVTWTKE